MGFFCLLSLCDPNFGVKVCDNTGEADDDLQDIDEWVDGVWAAEAGAARDEVAADAVAADGEAAGVVAAEAVQDAAPAVDV